MQIKSMSAVGYSPNFVASITRFIHFTLKKIAYNV